MRAFSLILIMVVVFPAYSQETKGAKLYVFLPSNMRPYSMEQSFTDACDKLQIQVFGRHRELRKTVDAAPPDAILTPQPVADSGQYDEFKRKLAASRDNAIEERYVLVSVGQPIDLADTAKLAIGAVDLLGRRGMQEFISQSLGGVEPRKIETVTKQDELLTILQFQDVDAIFIPDYLVDSYYRKRSKMDLKVTELPTKVGLPVLAVKSEDPQKLKMLMECLQGMAGSINSKLGIDRWITP